MRIIAYNVRKPLERKEEEFMKIQQLIHAKENFLMEKQKKLRVITKQNRFLDEVRNDYVKYYEYISNQKHEQIKALHLINEYINKLTITGELSKQNINDAKEEQRKIMREIKSIKKTLDTAFIDTDNIQETIKGKEFLV